MWSCPRLQNFLNNYMSQPFRLVWRTSLRTSSMMFNDGLILAIKCTKPLRDVRGKKFQSPMLSCCAIDISLLEHNAGNTQFYLKHEMWPIVDRRLCVLNELLDIKIPRNSVTHLHGAAVIVSTRHVQCVMLWHNVKIVLINMLLS